MTDDTVEISAIRIRSERNYREYGIHERSATAIADIKTLLTKIKELEDEIDYLEERAWFGH